MMPLTFDKIPHLLKQRAQWVMWKLELRGDKATKVPYTLRGSKASSTNPKTWATFEEVATRFLTCGCDGIGYVFSESDPYTGVDLDWKAYQGDGIPNDALALLEHFCSYSEFSPSGKGCHIFIEGTISSGRKKKLSPTLEIEMYSSGRFFTVTGLHIANTPLTIEDRSEVLQTLYKTLFDNKERPVQKPVTRQPLNLSDSQVIERAKGAKNGSVFTALFEGNTSAYSSHSEADLALCFHLNFWTGGDAEAIDRLFRESGLFREKWDKRHYGDGKTYGQATVEKALTGAVIEHRAVPEENQKLKPKSFRSRLYQRLRAL